MEHDTGWINIFETETTHCQARRIGRTVFVKCDVWDGMSLGKDWKAFTTLPEGMKPDRMQYFAGSSISGYLAVNVRISPSGVISVVCDGSNTSYWAFSASFLAA